MKVTPVRRYRSPRYPTRKEILANPQLLSGATPARWKANKIVSTALAFYVFRPPEAPATPPGPADPLPMVAESPHAADTAEVRDSLTSHKDLPVIAPLFLHGEGRGATGCVVMAPPIFLSEEEARQIIETELLKVGISFDQKDLQLDDVSIGPSMENKLLRDSDAPWRAAQEGAERVPVCLDGYSTAHNLAYEVVTADDYYKFGGKREASSVQSYDLVGAATALRDQMKQHGKLNVVVFYDPLEHFGPMENVVTIRSVPQDADEVESEEHGELGDDRSSEDQKGAVRLRERSIQQLKLQISDFIAWFRQQTH